MSCAVIVESACRIGVVGSTVMTGLSNGYYLLFRRHPELMEKFRAWLEGLSAD